VETDKNKGQSGESVQGLIERILRDLNRLDGSLTVFRQSEHPLRGEALRWHVPVLKARLAGLRRLRRNHRGPEDPGVLNSGPPTQELPDGFIAEIDAGE
jgi:hypothetical protein